ncbi:phage tail assembly protein [Shinella granuli]|uniref:Tail assembly chaperone E/41/14-like protein n=1 Tax=Shinella granuli TaxID=323621 RepID=A0A4R2D341_SHIGR|nr:phage tail assembly protein [Shinella granuli]TCN48888.1 tail assembly chaperone E/41/14-like protein [Shinella granuli]
MTTYTLKTPVEHNNKTYSTLTFRTAKVGDLMVVDAVKGEMTQSVAIIAAIADVPIQVIKGMDLLDFKGASEAAAPFLAGFEESTATGSTS